MAFFEVYPEHHDCMDFTVDIEQGVFQLGGGFKYFFIFTPIWGEFPS